MIPLLTHKPLLESRVVFVLDPIIGRIAKKTVQNMALSDQSVANNRPTGGARLVNLMYYNVSVQIHIFLIFLAKLI